MCITFSLFLSVLDKHVKCTHLFIDALLNFNTFGILL